MDNNQQKTTFWDFKHKKAYINEKEKIIDFLFGLIGIPIFVAIIFLLIEYIINIFYPIIWPKLLGYAYFYLIIAFCLFLLVYAAMKRKCMFYGLLTAAILYLASALVLTSNG